MWVRHSGCKYRGRRVCGPGVGRRGAAPCGEEGVGTSDGVRKRERGGISAMILLTTVKYNHLLPASREDGEHGALHVRKGRRREGVERHCRPGREDYLT